MSNKELESISENKSKKNIIYAFIDAANLWEAQKAKGCLFDYQKMKSFLQTAHSGSEIKVFFYTAYPREGTRDYSVEGKFKFYTFLEKGLGFTVRKKELKRIYTLTPEGPKIVEKGNMDVEMTIDAVQYIKKYNTAIFFTGDSDFLALVTKIRNRNKKVYIYSSKDNVSEELKTGGDGYFDVLEIQEDIWGRILQKRESK